MDLNDIIESVKIEEYIGQYVEDFEEKGGELWCISLFNTHENTPSFSINPNTQVFYDFSSGKGGNVLSFIQHYEKCDLQTAINKLKKFANITDGAVISKRLTATQILKRYKKPKEKIKESSGIILDKNYMNKYKFNEEKLKSWIEEGIDLEILRQHEVMYDEFSNRIVYPIYDSVGNLINVSGRTLDPDYKEKKLRKYTYFKPLGDLDTIYWLHQNREYILEKKEIILFEGAKSVMKAEGWGFRNAGAILTSHLNPQQLKILMKLGVTVVLALDEDVIVEEDENIKKLKRFVRVQKIVNQDGLLGSKMAPVDNGKEVFVKLYNNRKELR